MANSTKNFVIWNGVSLLKIILTGLAKQIFVYETQRKLLINGFRLIMNFSLFLLTTNLFLGFKTEIVKKSGSRDGPLLTSSLLPIKRAYRY
jgi:hypothetical protein